MPLYDLTEDEAEWVGIAIENCLESAKLVMDNEDEDPLDRVDAGLLVQKYTALQEKFPAPEIGLKGDDDA